jgi:hypothetical protein
MEVFCQRGFRIFSLTVIYLFIKAGYAIGAPRLNCRFPSQYHRTIPLYLDLDSVKRYYPDPTPQRFVDTLRLAAEIWNKYGKSRAKIVINTMRKGDRIPFPHKAGEIEFDFYLRSVGAKHGNCGVGSIVYFSPLDISFEDLGFIHRDTDNPSLLRTALHEFGHVLGLHFFLPKHIFQKKIVFLSIFPLT